MLTRARGIVAAVAVAAAVALAGAATADAKLVSASDDDAAQFSQGTQAGTVVRASPGGDGWVELARTLEQQFDAAPSGWATTSWGGPEGTATVVDGSLVVDGARADSGVAAAAGASLRFRATLGEQAYSHVGFAADFNAPPWAMFTTGGDGAGKLYARTADGSQETGLEIAGVSAAVPHDYRIDWTATGFEFSVDGVLVATQPVAVAGGMTVQASNYAAGGGGPSIDSAVLDTHTTPGTFTSRILDAGDDRVTGIALDATSATPDGTGITYETRTAGTAGGIDAAPWSALGAAGAVADPARYVQYRGRSPRRWRPRPRGSTASTSASPSTISRRWSRSPVWWSRAARRR